ncbi:SAM-dependent methyltransferase [Helicobacter suis]|uniref:SAM-dependent methyltransferase n=1 Tax=Helicobacter suis TaxID=104628 RepID=UPI001F082C44|nr:SAM-dependent methyltransferase [Helicobacter suis]
MLLKYINPQDYILLDSSCGYGIFLHWPGFNAYVGVDKNNSALEEVRKTCKHAILLHKNALHAVMRENFHIPSASKLVIVGNPPYNDRTSRVRSSLKDKEALKMDTPLKARDIGISFLRSFDLLKADYVCVLHPLSYLIKRANLKSLKDFAKNYRLLEGLVLSSQIFCPKSSGYFPIILALYKRDIKGLDEGFIAGFDFLTLEGKSFRLQDWDFISAYVDKYPNKQRISKDLRVSMFYTLRDINALFRSKTFLEEESPHAIYITQEKYSLYCYIDVFKTQIPHIPYYLRNCDVFLDYAKFKKLEDHFIIASQTKKISPEIERYFKDLLGVHYEN